VSGLSLSGTGLTITGGSGGGGGGTSGQFGPVLTNAAVPTSASTGLTTWQNQVSSTVADTPVGIAMTLAPSGSPGFSYRTRPAPATPYTATALISCIANTDNYVSSALMFSDGTKNTQVFWSYTNTANLTYIVQNNNSPTSFAGNLFVAASAPYPNPLWLQIQDDGTNVYFRVSADGYNFITPYSMAKAGSFLGASGYTNIGWGISYQAGYSGTPNIIGTLMYWNIS